METLGAAFPKEQARLRKLLSTYQSIGPAGAFARAAIEDCLRRADQAAISSDVVEMIRVYKEMQEFTE